MNLITNDNESILHSLFRSPVINSELVYFVVENLKSIETVSKEGKTPFSLLCSNTTINNDLIKLFLERKCDANIQDSNKNTPTHLICANSKVNIDILNLFLSHNANFENFNSENLNPLYYLSKNKFCLDPNVLRFIFDNMKEHPSFDLEQLIYILENTILTSEDLQKYPQTEKTFEILFKGIFIFFFFFFFSYF